MSQNQREAAEKKMKDLTKERDVLLEKIKYLNGEKVKVCSMMEAKCNELFNAQKEMEKMKEEINSREIKVRWGQNKLKSETESHKETQSKLEKSQQQVRQLKDELEEVKRACAEIKAREQQAVQQKENGLKEEQLLEEKAKLIVEKQSMEEQFTAYRNALKEFENLRIRHTQLVGENEDLTNKVLNMLKSYMASISYDFFVSTGAIPIERTFAARAGSSSIERTNSPTATIADGSPDKTG
jgi:chromosome segregation ATPase